MLTPEELDRVHKVAIALAKAPEKWKRHWCFGAQFGECGCIGCANHAGGLLKAGLTYDDWRLYMGNKPPPYDVACEAHRRSYELIRSKYPDLGLPASGPEGAQPK